MTLPDPAGLLGTPTLADAPALPSIDALPLAGQVGAEVAAALSAALERVHLLVETGRIGRHSLLALMDEIHQARRIAIIGQQVSRLASGHVRQACEALELPHALRGAIGQRAEAIAARGLELRQRLQPAAVSADPSLLFTLLANLLDWALEHCRGTSMLLDTGLHHWPVHAVLRCEFTWCAPDRVAGDAGAPPPQTMAWRLVEHAAQAMGVRLLRQDTAQSVQISLAFPETPRRWPRLVDAPAAPAAPGAARHRPPVDGDLLLFARRPDSRRLVHEALAGTGMALRVASDLAGAHAVARAGMPQALVVDARDPEIDRLIAELRAGRGGPALLHVGDAFQGMEISTAGGFEIARLARGEVTRELPAALGHLLHRH